jgi:hypothetical protein
MTPSAGFPDPPRAAPQLTAQNLTAHALRMKGVPETDIAAAIGNPERMKQLIYQTFGAGSAKAPATSDDLWSGRTPAEPLVLAPQQHGKGDRQPAGLPSWAQAPGGNPFVAAPGGVSGMPALTEQNLTAHALRMKGVTETDIAAAMGDRGKLQQLIGKIFSPPNPASTPQTAPDKYRQAAIDEIARLKQAGAPLQNGYTKRLTHGFLLGTDNRLASLMLAPIEMYRHGTGYWEGYDYAKAREDLLDDESRENTGWLGTGLETLGGTGTGVGLASHGVTAARFLAAEAGLLKRAAASAIDSAVRNGFAGSWDGNGLQERATNAAKRAGYGALFGAAVPFAPLGWAGLKAAASPIIRKFAP